MENKTYSLNYENTFLTYCHETKHQTRLLGIKFEDSQALVFLTWIEDGGWKVGLVGRIRKMLRLQAKPIVLMINLA